MATHTTTQWRSTPVDRTDNVSLVREHITYKKTKDNRVLWHTGEPVVSAPIIIPINELHLVIAELATAMAYQLEDWEAHKETDGTDV